MKRLLALALALALLALPSMGWGRTSVVNAELLSPGVLSTAYSGSSASSVPWTSASSWYNVTASSAAAGYPGSGTGDSGGTADTITNLTTGGTITLASGGLNTISITSITNSSTGIILQLTGGTTAMTLLSSGTAVSYFGSTASNGCITNSGGGMNVSAPNAAVVFYSGSNGYAFSQPSGGTITLAAASGAILAYSGTTYGQGVHVGGGVFSLTGNGVATGATANGGFGIQIIAGAGSWAGVPIVSGTGIFPTMVSSGGAAGLAINSGSCNWNGTASLAAGKLGVFRLGGGTVNLNGLSFSNSGQLALIGVGATVIQGAGVITNSTSSAQFFAANLSTSAAPGSWASGGGTSLTWEDGSTTPSGVTTLVVNGGTSDGSFGTTSGTITDVSAGSLTGGYFTTNLTGSNVAYNIRYGPSGGSLGTAPRPGPNMQAARTTILPGAIGAAAAIILTTFILVYLRRKQCR